jgi:hypothetical protein
MNEILLTAACTLMLVFLLGLILWACGIIDIEVNLGEGENDGPQA